MNPTGLTKRQKELRRKERQTEKAAKKLERRRQKTEQPAVAEGEDPDIAGIIPGSQPPLET